MHRVGGARPNVKFVLICLVIAIAGLIVIEAAGGSTRTPAPDAARVLRYWTPERMESARPLELVVDRQGISRLRFGRPASGAGASFLTIGTPEVPPYSFNGRIFIKVGNLRGYCSGTAINSPSRQLVLTAGHCVNAGGRSLR